MPYMSLHCLNTSEVPVVLFKQPQSKCTRSCLTGFGDISRVTTALVKRNLRKYCAIWYSFNIPVSNKIRAVHF
jgi:hypothetical protein